MGRLSGFLSISAGDKVRVVVAATLLLIVQFGFAFVSFSSLRRVLLGVSTTLSRIVPGIPAPIRIAWAVEATDRNVPGKRTCLMRSLTSETMHRLYHHDIIHRIGVDPSGTDADDLETVTVSRGTFEAHSWIEHEGEILLGDLEDLSRFEPLPPLNGADDR
ncbi:lasso peptide biosynthesis B2 protein [Natrarchaeobius halalkaliphilus]|uniref:Lasso peptide biosynthesis B2 protein n=1 Tax=Natrarchaeobius halalkaliphilus TaxID=1679091 RepID=A0A3N6M0R1_9EURY|nr:lasso peptide biosynthesis B2 protein [Natrarchaeobius halalkaliphilus]RQG89230.1 lasso peptide biosynthesis B2 protein [Natrarchaeobius halalkaliphilus]